MSYVVTNQIIKHFNLKKYNSHNYNGNTPFSRLQYSYSILTNGISDDRNAHSHKNLYI